MFKRKTQKYLDVNTHEKYETLAHLQAKTLWFKEHENHVSKVIHFENFNQGTMLGELLSLYYSGTSFALTGDFTTTLKRIYKRFNVPEVNSQALNYELSQTIAYLDPEGEAANNYFGYDVILNSTSLKIKSDAKVKILRTAEGQAYDVKVTSLKGKVSYFSKHKNLKQISKNLDAPFFANGLTTPKINVVFEKFAKSLFKMLELDSLTNCKKLPSCEVDNILKTYKKAHFDGLENSLVSAPKTKLEETLQLIFKHKDVYAIRCFVASLDLTLEESELLDALCSDASFEDVNFIGNYLISKNML